MKRTLNLFRLAILCCGCGLLQTAISAAPISYTTPGATYAEGFNDSLPGGAETFPWVDGETFSGWYAQYADPDGTNYTNPPAEYRRTFGISTGIRVYQWRASASATDGSLGANPINDTGDVLFGLALQNNSGLSMDSFSIGYTGEQWRATTGDATTIGVSYQFGSATDLTAGVWTEIPALLFTSPHFNQAASSNISGKNAENHTVFDPVTIAGVDWQPGEQLWIRFAVENISGVSQGLAIDDVTFSAIPEPSTYALLFGAGILAAACISRRRAAR